MSEDSIKIMQGLIDVSNALIARVETLEKAAAQHHQALDRAITQLYHLGLRVRELDTPTPAIRRYGASNN